MENKQMEQIFEAIKEERERQEKKWGQQNHPILDQVLLSREGSCVPERMCEEYEIPTEWRAKSLCNGNFSRGTGTYMHILIEEVSEAVSCLSDTESMRKELIQCAAVVVAMIESLDRNGK